MIACYPLASPPGTLRLWVGAHPVTAAPVVERWTLGGTPVAPGNLTTLRPMQSVRGAGVLAGNPGRAFSGVYEIGGVAAAASVTLGLNVGGERIERRVKPLPARIDLNGDPLNVLLISCFHYSTDGGRYAEILPRIVRGADAPDLAIFMGDQVYLDLPTIKNFPDDPAWLADKFETDYVRNWFYGGFSQGLGIAPIALAPDDHEYWNNFPHPSPFIQNSWSGKGQARWRDTARSCYEGFQLGLAGALGTALELDVEPLAFLVVDSRTDRDPEFRQLLSPAASAQLTAWAARVARDDRLTAAVIVTGQSLLEDPVGSAKGSVADYALANYEQPYKDLLAVLIKVTEAGKPVLLLTGDVHWGRVTSVRDRRRGATTLYEVISSPASLVETVGSDQVADVIGAVKRWVGAGDAWPRHSDGQPPPSHLPHSGQRFRTGAWRAHRGNQVVTLRMARRGAGVAVDYTFHPLIASASSVVPPTRGHFELSPTQVA